MRTSKQPLNKSVDENSNRLRKDGKPLFAEKLARVNAVLAKTGLPDLDKKE